MGVTDRGNTQAPPGFGVSAVNTVDSGTFTPTAGNYILVNATAEWQTGTNGACLMSDTWGDTGGTAWVRIANAERLGITTGQYAEQNGWYGRLIGTGPSSGHCTFTRPAGTVDTMQIMDVFEVDVPSGYVVTFPHTAAPTFQSGVTSLAADFGAAPDSASLIFTSDVQDNTTTLAIVPSGFTTFRNLTANGTTFANGWKNGSGTQTHTWTGLATGASQLICAVEMKISAPAPAGTFVGLTPVLGSSGTGGTFTTTGIDTTGAGLITVGVVDNGAGVLTDSAGNTWVFPDARVGTVGGLRIGYCIAPITSPTHTFTLTGASQNGDLAVRAYFATGTVSIDGHVTNGGSGSTVQPGSITPSQPNGLLVAVATSNNTSGTQAVDSSFVIEMQRLTQPGQSLGVVFADLIETAAVAKNPTFSGASMSYVGSAMVAFKVAAPPYPPRVLIPAAAAVRASSW